MMNVTNNLTTSTNRNEDCIDHYESLVNDRLTGPITSIQGPKDIVTSIHGIMLDIDPKDYQRSYSQSAIENDPVAFSENTLDSWLSNHPVLKKAERRMSGTGIHVLLWFEQPVFLETDSDRDRWDCIIKMVQCCLLSDAGQSSITCCTRPVGSVNSKNGASVLQLKPGELVSEQEIKDLAEAMRTKPFRTVCEILFGAGPVSPCPVCHENGTSLTAFDRMGKCYKCKTVSLADLYNTNFTTTTEEQNNDTNA